MAAGSGLLIRANVPLAPHTTFHLGGPAAFFAEVTTEEEVREAALFAKKERLPLRVLGAGSNVLVPDEGIEAVVILMGVRGMLVTEEEDSHILLVAGAGERWDTVVAAAATRGLYGIENLAGIPGSVGGAVVQNIGAYGAELSQAFAYADVYSLATGTVSRVSSTAAAFGYRTSTFKHDADAIILRAAFRLSGTGVLKLSYPDLRRAEEAGDVLSTPHGVVRVVRRIREAKFPSLAIAGTAGSFFKNPTLSPEEAAVLLEKYPELPQFLQPDTRVKIPLAWILDHVLHLKGYAVQGVRAFEKQPLVIVAEPGTTAHDVVRFAETIAARVFDATSVHIEWEVEYFSAQKK